MKKWIFVSFLFPICGLGLIALVALWADAGFSSSDEGEFATQSVQSFTKSFPDCGFSITSPCELQDVSQHSSGDFLVNLGGVTDGNNRAKMAAYQLIVTKLPVDYRDAQRVDEVLTKACERFYGVKKVRVGRGRFPGYVGYAKHQGMVQKGLICAVNQYAVSLSVMTNGDLETKFIEFSNGFEITAENKMTVKSMNVSSFTAKETYSERQDLAVRNAILNQSEWRTENEQESYVPYLCVFIGGVVLVFLLVYLVLGKGKQKEVQSKPAKSIMTTTKSNGVFENTGRENNLITMEKIKKQVQNTIHLYECGNIPALQQQLYELYINFNQRGGGKLIVNFPEQDQLAECFTLMLRFDWTNDSDIREVWAENGFYCIVNYLNGQRKNVMNLSIGGFNLFLHLCVARESLKPKVQQILNKAVVLMNPLFKEHFLNNNADYLLDQFLYLAAQLMEPLIKMHGDNLLQSQYKKKYDSILQNKFIEQKTTSVEVLNKATFVAQVIGSVLQNM